MMEINKGVIGLIALIVGAMGTVGTASLVGSGDEQLLLVEIFKFFLFTCAIGGATLIYSEIEKRNIETQEVKNSKLLFRTEIWDTSHTVALSRRMMKCISNFSSDGVEVQDNQVWFDHVVKLNESQLRVEKLRRFLETKPPEFLEENESLERDLRIIDHYLRSILKEIEAAASTTKQWRYPSDTSVLMEFLYSEKAPEYVSAFSRLNNLLLRGHPPHLI